MKKERRIETDNVLALKIRELRDVKHWTQEELAERAGLKRSHIQRLEHGDYKESKLSTLVKVARAFGIYPQTFLASLGVIDMREFYEGSDSDKVLNLRLEAPDIWLFFTEYWDNLDSDTKELVRRFLNRLSQKKA